MTSQTHPKVCLLGFLLSLYPYSITVRSGAETSLMSTAMTAQMSCTADDFDKLQHDLEKEWASVGGWSRLHVVYGRRPLGEGL